MNSVAFADSIFQDVNADWPLMSLEDVCEDIFDCPHSTPKLVDRSNYHMVRTQDIRSGFFDVSSAVFVSEETYTERTKRTIPKFGDILLSREGTYFGDAAEVPKNLKVCLGQRMVLLRPKSELIKTSFLRIWINSTVFQRYLLGFRDGTVAERLNVSTIRELPIPLPSLEEQEQIITRLVPLEQKEAINRQMNATLEAMAQALFKSWFVDFDPVIDNALAAGNPIPDELEAKAAARQALGDARKPLSEDIRSLFPNAFVFTEEMGWIPEGWETGELQDLLILQRGFDLPKDKRRDGAFPLIASSGQDGTHDEFKAKYSCKSFSEKPPFTNQSVTILKFRGTYAQVLIGPSVVTGRSGRIGVIIFVYENHWPLNTTLWVKEYKNSNPYHAYFLLMSLDLENYHTGSAVPTLNRNHVHSLPQVLPSTAILDEFESKIASMFEKKRTLESNSIFLEKIRGALLPKLLSGELRIPEAKRLVEEVL